MQRRFPSSIRLLLVVLVLLLSVGTTGSAVRRPQSAGPGSDFVRAAIAAMAHGKWDEAEKLAAARGAEDPDAPVVLAKIAIARGKYREAQAMLDPIVSRDPTGDAALELALLYRTIGRSSDAQPLFTALFRQGGSSSDPLVLYRAARAAHALNRPRDAGALYREAERAGGDPAVIETAWGLLFLEKYNYPEALKSFDAALKADEKWAPAYAGMARVLEDDDPPKAADAAAKAIAIDPSLAGPHLLLARLRMDEDKDAEAKAEIEKVLEGNPSQ